MSGAWGLAFGPAFGEGPLPFTPSISPFPPAQPTSMTTIIPSYLYEEYSDDSDLQAFVSSYNQLAQTFLNTVANLNLPIYTADAISGPLLDWVAQGLYGISRPSLFTGESTIVGELNTYEMNVQKLDWSEIVGPTNVTATSDDTFKRIITWAFYKGDGKTFNVQWLKRRIMRFLIGEDGTAPPIDQTDQISVTFGANNSGDIRFIDQITKIISGAIFNNFEMNTQMINGLNLMITPLTPLPYRLLFQEAVETGALELPFQIVWTVTL